MEFVSAIEAVSVKGSLEPVDVVDEKHGGFDIVFLLQFAEEDFGQTGCIRRKEPKMEELIVSGSIAAYSQYCCPSSRITVSSSAT